MARIQLIGLLLGLLVVSAYATYCKNEGEKCNSNTDCCSNCCKKKPNDRRRSLLNDDDKKCQPSDKCSGTSGDPVLTGFDGSVYEFTGLPFTYWNLLSAKDHNVNGYFTPAVMHDHNGTYITAVGFTYGIHQVAARVLSDGALDVEVNGNSLRMADGETELALRLTDAKNPKAGDLTVSWELYRPLVGNSIALSTPFMTLRVFAVAPGTVDEGGVQQPSYLNTNFELHGAPAGNAMNGVLGRSYNQLVRVLTSGGTVAHEVTRLTVEEVPELRVSGLFDQPNVRFGKVLPARRMVLEIPAVSFPVVATAVRS